jgi:hypothetical protein
MKKNRVIIPALFVVLLLGGCIDGLLVDPVSVDTNALKQTEIEKSAPAQEQPLAEEPVAEENTSIPEELPAEEPDIIGDIPVMDPLSENMGDGAAAFNWAVFIAQKAAWEQMAWGQTGYQFGQGHTLSDSVFSMTKIYLIYHDALLLDWSGRGADPLWDPFLRADTMSKVYDIIYGWGIMDTAALADKGWTSFVIKYDDKFHYPKNIQITDNNGVVYTVNILIFKLDVHIESKADTTTGTKGEQKEIILLNYPWGG